MNKVIDAVASGASKFGNAWEGNAQITRRLSGSSIAIGLRPSYYYYKEESGTDAKYNLGGFTIFPMLKWYMLEDKSIKFYSQFGIGYGHMSGEIEETGGNVKFSGSNIGYMLGLGAEFCIVPGHCINVEGGARFLSFNRFIVDSTSGFFTGDSIITQADKGKEFEIEDDGERDFAASMSGILAMLGYTFYF
ncbi:MAG: hypothetical protein A2Z20_10795 [Bdellovibrionales bacterium RBG_16_40_8]|nr:MAG: hypothetical protein A2Z20_10795 [Bdellovibrionales bacterium RBG_16_40_8]